MSKNVLTSDKLVSSIRRRAMIPDDTATFEDIDLLEIANEEIDVEILPNLMSLNEEFLVTHVDIPVQDGVNRYEIPYRAVANKVRDIMLVGNSQLYEVVRIDLERLSDYSHTSNYMDTVAYVENNEIVFVRTSSSGFDFVRIYYYRSPSRLVPTNRAAQITDINRTTGIIRVNSVPDNFLEQTSFGQSPVFDFISSTTPNKIYNFDVAVANGAINQFNSEITFSLSDIPSNLVIGDYICESQETIIPQIPSEMHPLLAQSVAVHVLESLGDQEGLAAARSRLAQMNKNVMAMTENRIEGAPQKIVSRYSPLQNALTSSGRRKRGR
jgi:hypothetical protein